MPHLIEPARSGRSRCHTCRRVIARGELRLVEEYVGGRGRSLAHRFHHLTCSADARPLVLRQALGAFGGSVDGRDELERRIVVALQRERERRLTHIGDATEPDALLARLAQDPNDTETLLVYADQLQARGDPRGELIVLQRELRLGHDARRRDPLLRRQIDLLARHGPRLVPPLLGQGDRIEWRDGFIRRLELCGKTGSMLRELPDLLQHASLRLLRELRVAFFLAPEGAAVVEGLSARPPVTLRGLELGDSYEHDLGPVSRLVERLPALERLVLEGRADLERLAHPRLGRLDLRQLDWCYPGGAVQALGRLDPRRLPNLRRMRLQTWQTDALCAALAASDWPGQLTHLDLSGGTMTPDGARALARGLVGRGLVRLDVGGNRLTAACRRLLEPVSVRLVFGEQQAGASAAGQRWFVRHTRRPEWGRGEVLRQFEGKLEVEFERAGRKVLGADLPFLESV